mmetsp:Transcript_9356/g.27390  ORF Transcript_9356/g.27390 Transcript_9356/m.27390 type:complete len:90 (+) Transcript_9356:1065-1334(+)
MTCTCCHLQKYLACISECSFKHFVLNPGRFVFFPCRREFKAAFLNLCLTFSQYSFEPLIATNGLCYANSTLLRSNVQQITIISKFCFES